MSYKMNGHKNIHDYSGTLIIYHYENVVHEHVWLQRSGMAEEDYTTFSKHERLVECRMQNARVFLMSVRISVVVAFLIGSVSVR